jgi:photosystem II stability/assembly factor-like uncharacterized protein
VLYTSAEDEDRGLFRSDDGGETWKVASAPFGAIAHVAVVPGYRDLVAAATRTRVYVSGDRGATWKQMPEIPGGPVNGLAAILDRGSIAVIAATARSLYRADLRGSRWRPVALPPQFTGALQSLSGAGGQALAATSNTSAIVSFDAGRSWHNCSSAGAGVVYALVPGAGPQRYVLAATSNGLFRSEDDCRTWTQISSGLNKDTVTLVAVNPSAPEIAFAAQNGAVFRSADSGRTWTALGDEGRFGLYPVALCIDADAPNRLYALFPGRGVLVQDLAPIDDAVKSAGPEEPVAQTNKTQGDVHP